jgi:multidrug resistance efflux pump
MFPEKSKRLWVGFAGPYFELFLWALATLTWRVTEPDTVVAYLALIVMTGSGVKTLLNFNPLLKLDGYYLLSDFLEIPNLRRKSFRLVGGHVKRLFGLGNPPTLATPREQRICLAYGLAATVGSLSFLAITLFTVGNLLIATGHQVLLVLFSAVVGLKLRRRFRRLFGTPSGKADDEDDGDEDGDEVVTSTPPEIAEVVPSRRKSRKKRRWPIRAAWGAIVAAALALLFLGRMELRIAGPFDVRPFSNADVRSSVDGIIEEVYVDEGDRVAAGAPIARLSDKDLRVELLKTEAEIKEAGAGLTILETGPTAQQIEVAQTAVATAQDQIAYAKSRLVRSRAMLEQGLLSEQVYEDHQELATAAENSLAEAQARLDALLTSIRPEQIQGTKASIERLSTQRRYLDAQLRLSTVVSPAAGVVATPSRELKELHGRLVTKGDLIAKVFDFETVTAYIAISEKEIADVQLGQKVVLRTRAYPDTDVYGTVTSIGTSARSSSTSGTEAPLGAPDANNSSGSRMILVTTEIDNRSGLLKPEMSGRAKILCGERRIVDLLVRRLARTVKVEFWSWW